SRDLETARAILQINCPRIALLGDLETLSGFQEFVSRFPPEDRHRKLGKGFPILPQVDDIPAEMDAYTHWICGRVFPAWIYRFFRLEVPGQIEPEAAIENNKNLFYLNCQMVERQHRLSRILQVGLLEKEQGPPLLGGCYIAGTGRDPKEQAFVN